MRALRAARGRGRRARRKLLDPKTRVALRGRMPNPWWRYRFHSFGPKSLLHRPIWLAGAHKMSIGEQCRIFPIWLSVEPEAWTRPGPALEIGNGVGIRAFCTISAAESVVIEDYVSMASFSQIVDWEHGLDGPHDQIERNPRVTKPVRIGRGTAIGERVAILPGSNIGRHCVIGTNSVVQGDIPDDSMVSGNPARIIGRKRESRISLGLATRTQQGEGPHA